jgi:Carboxypeptidase regulatory-like domain
MKPILITLLAVFLIKPFAWCQSSAGAVSGTVRDQTGAVIPGAAVSIVNTATNVKVPTKANEAGFYLFPGVAPGSYVLTVEFTGMQKYEVNIAVQVSQSVVIDPTLQPAGTMASKANRGEHRCSGPICREPRRQPGTILQLQSEPTRLHLVLEHEATASHGEYVQRGAASVRFEGMGHYSGISKDGLVELQRD